MATIDEFVLTNIGLWWRYGISWHCEKWKYIIIGRIFESEIILIPPSLKISESSSNVSYRNTDEVWWRYGISRSCDECFYQYNVCHDVTYWSKRGNKWEMLSYEAWTGGRTAVCHNKPVFWRAYKNERPMSWNYEYIIVGQIIFQNFHQFKAFVGLSDCRTVGL